MIRMERIRSSCKRWRAAFRQNGIDGLFDTRKENSGRRSEKELTLEEKYQKILAQNNLLKAENELLKKIEMMEKRLYKKK